MKTNNITRAIKKESKKLNLESKRTHRNGDLVTYEFKRANSDIGEYTSVELIVNILSYRNEFLKPLIEKASYEISKCEKDIEKKIKRIRILNNIKEINDGL